jgi:multicomponent Na+:H+ antiporter subunit D
MVVGVGIGTELALNGTAAHAFCHILYKSLLFMSVGAVMYRTGTSKASELGGLYKTMPVTMVCCLVGAASISAFPLFSGFVSKSLILDASAGNGYYVVWMILLIASAGVLSHSGIKIPYFTFFAHDSGKRPAEAPVHMRLAMIITAALCILIGVFPGLLYTLLPYEVDYQPYTFGHVLVQFQLLLFALLAFVFLMKTGLHPPEVRATNIDTDVLYRKFVPSVLPTIVLLVVAANRAARQIALSIINAGAGALERVSSPGTPLARGWSVASMMFVVVMLMCVLLVLNLL